MNCTRHRDIPLTICSAHTGVHRRHRVSGASQPTVRLSVPSLPPCADEIFTPSRESQLWTSGTAFSHIAVFTSHAPHTGQCPRNCWATSPCLYNDPDDDNEAMAWNYRPKLASSILRVLPAVDGNSCVTRLCVCVCVLLTKERLRIQSSVRRRSAQLSVQNLPIKRLPRLLVTQLI